MPKYLGTLKFSSEGLKGLRKDGAANRVEVSRVATASLGGTLECYYYAFGENDVYAVLDLPDDEAAAAASVTVNASGLVKATFTKLLTAEQVDEAFKRTVDYRPPGT
jgi:uncharacterized protein with GYD domain